MGFLQKTLKTLFYPATAAAKAISSGGKKVESVFDGILDGIAMFFETGMGIVLLGGTVALLLLAKNPKLALLAL